MTITTRIRSFRSNGDDTASLPGPGVTCIVGPNNEGKTRLLGSIYSALSGRLSDQPSSLVDIAVDHPDRLTVEEAAAHLERFGSPGINPGSLEQGYYFTGQFFTPQRFINEWYERGQFLGGASNWFAAHYQAGALSEYASGSINANPDYSEAHALAQVWNDRSLEAEISGLCLEAFGFPLTFDRYNSYGRFVLGVPMTAGPNFYDDRRPYAKELALMPPLSDQGQGLKSFIGIALMVITQRPRILILDEPEVFLHPAQARMLGRWLGQRSITDDMQLVAATHDKDLLVGLLEGAPSAMNVVRVTRQGSLARLQEIGAGDLDLVWGNPVHRYSNVLQGVFYKGTVVCESDADCRFFNAAVQEYAISVGRRAEADEILFVPAGGKRNIPDRSSAIAAIGARAMVIADFDLLQDSRDLERTVRSVRGDWEGSVKPLHDTFSQWASDASAWPRPLKKSGLAGVTSGAIYKVARTLLDALAAAGIFVIPLGEMEDFDKTITEEKGAWVTEALSRDLHRKTGPLWEFIAQLLDFDVNANGLPGDQPATGTE